MFSWGVRGAIMSSMDDCKELDLALGLLREVTSVLRARYNLGLIIRKCQRLGFRENEYGVVVVDLLVGPEELFVGTGIGLVYACVHVDWAGACVRGMEVGVEGSGLGGVWYFRDPECVNGVARHLSWVYKHKSELAIPDGWSDGWSRDPH